MLEASPRLGGPLRSEVVGGRIVDLGPDGFLGRRPEAFELCGEVGLADALVPIAARGASVWARGRLRTLPEGHALGIPTRFWPTARSGIVGVRGSLGLARDAVLPRPDVRGPIGDRAIGPLVTRKLGRRVVDMLVDPLIGGIHAGSVDDMSAAATFPPLLAAAQRRGGLMRALRAEVPAPDPDGPPLFWALDDGMASLVGTLAAGLRRAAWTSGSSSPAVLSSARSAGAWTAGTAADAFEADAVVLATPAPAAAASSGPMMTRRRACWTPSTTPRSSLVTFRVGADDVPRRSYGTGFLVPRRSPAQGARAVGGHGVHVPGSQVAAPRTATATSCCGPRSDASTTPGPATGPTTKSPSGPGRSWAC